MTIEIQSHQIQQIFQYIFEIVKFDQNYKETRQNKEIIWRNILRIEEDLC